MRVRLKFLDVSHVLDFFTAPWSAQCLFWMKNKNSRRRKKIIIKIIFRLHLDSSFGICMLCCVSSEWKEQRKTSKRLWQFSPEKFYWISCHFMNCNQINIAASTAEIFTIAWESIGQKRISLSDLFYCFVFQSNFWLNFWHHDVGVD